MIRPFGDGALLVEVAGVGAAQALAEALVADPIPGVEAAVPGLTSVLVELSPDAMAATERIQAALRGRMARPGSAAPGRLRTIPVIYGGEHGPDLAEVAATSGMAPEEYARRHAATTLRVLLCGFAPGFAYLGDLPYELRVPRLATPRSRTPAGSVAVAGAMSGIYPAELPGGWRVIGRTPVRLFDPHREPPAYLVPRDLVRFESMTPQRWRGDTATPDDW